MDKKIRKDIVAQNIFMCKYAVLKQLPIAKSIKNYYNSNFFVNTTTNFADVYIKSMHSLIIAKEFVKNGMNPIIITTVSKEFDGSNIENSQNMHDVIINTRTNFPKTITASNLYPLKNSEVVYSKYLTVIRDETLQFNMNDMYRIGLITAAPIHEPELIDNGMNLPDYFETKELIENLFQTAYAGAHDVLIFGDIGCKSTNSSIKDIVDILNIMILKYGYYFKFIVFAIPITDNADAAIFTYFNKEIVKPQDLGADKDNLLEGIDISGNILSIKDINKPEIENGQQPVLLNMFNNMINK